MLKFKRKKCHYFRCVTNQYNEDDWEKNNAVTLHSIISLKTRIDILDRMNIASYPYPSKIPARLNSILICSLHFPDSAFQYRRKMPNGSVRQKLNEDALCYDWRDSCSMEEIEEIEAQGSFQQCLIKEFIEEQKARGSLSPRIEHSYSQPDPCIIVPHRATRDEVELVPLIPIRKISPGVNMLDLEEPGQNEKLFPPHMLTREEFLALEGNSKSPSSEEEEEDQQQEEAGSLSTVEELEEEPIYLSSEPEAFLKKEGFCRLCSKIEEPLIGIFDELGCNIGLAEKINKVLPIIVSESDNLPLKVCVQCITNLESIYEMYNQVAKADRCLRSKFKITDEDEPENVDVLKAMMDDIGIEDNDHEHVDSMGFTDDDGAQDNDLVDHTDEEASINNEALHQALEKVLDPSFEASYSTLICSMCNISFTKDDEYTEHFRKKHLSKLRRCSICQVYYRNKTLLRNHWRQLHMKSVKTAVPAPKKKKKKITKKSHKCNRCNATFYGKIPFKRHMLEEHRKTLKFLKSLEEPTVKCDFCDEMFMNSGLKENHMENVHLQYKPYKCRFCPKVFRRKLNRNYHENTHDSKKALLCPTCGGLFGSKLILAAHMRTHLEPLTCQVCSKKIPPDRMKAHMLGHTGDRNFPCSECQVKFPTKQSLQQHMQAHLDERFACNLCAYVAKRKSLIHTHFRQKHAFELGSGLFHCAIDGCDAQFKSNALFYLHVVSIHQACSLLKDDLEDGVDSFYCKYCDSRFDSPLIAISHMRRTHKDVKTPIYTCSVCNMETTSVYKLVSHLFTHPESLRYKCRMCLEKFPSSRSRSTHEYKEHYENRRQCPYCDQRVPHINFENHVALHTAGSGAGEQYTCEVCDELFVEQSKWKNHMDMHMLAKEKVGTIGGENFPCRFCGKAFDSGYRRRFHENVHTKPKYFKCPDCDFTCLNIQTARKHKRETQHAKHMVHERNAEDLETEIGEILKEAEEEEVKMQEVDENQYSYIFTIS
ncbi:zinc finger protein 595-like [Neocloeon triangulifer]|uniref:zinc finger protein 595-like n=1 Tax=Neocloeon triangulifer TaxID=2078957 RepID=UPI00286F5A42|nr:zinc finger protein 595-like [Neocloeon triangulifer]